MVGTIFIGDAVFCVAIGFLTGVLAASFGWNLLEFTGWLAVAVCVVLILARTTTFVAFRAVQLRLTGAFGTLSVFIALSMIAIGIGVHYYRFFLARQAANEKLPNGAVLFSAIIIDEPTTSDRSILLKANLEEPYAGAVTIFAPLDSQYRYGDELRMTGTVSAPDTDGESPAIFPKTIALAGRHKASVLRESLIGFKLAIIDRYAAVLPSDEAMLLGGITFGAKQNFKADLKNAMATSGTTHLVAISGYNITIVILAAESLLGRWFGRRTKFFATTTLIVLFIAMTGLQSSAIRAAIMGFLALAAKQSGRVFNLSHAIVLTAAIMVIIQPTVLAHDVGFELSFLSLLGIVCLCDPLKKLFRLETGGVMDWKDSAVTTLAAQLGTMPVLIAVFNQFSATAILPNVLILGTVPLTMLLGFMLAVVECVSAYLGFFIGKLTGLLLAYQLGVIQFFAAFALPLPIAFNSAVIFIFYYGALAWFALSYRGESSTTQKA